MQYARAALDGDLRNTESNIVVFEETPATPSPVDALRRRLWSEHLGMSGPADPPLDDASATDWLQFWNQKAKEKLAGLLVNPNTALVEALGEPGTGARACHIEQVEAGFDRGEARLRHWNRVAGLSPGRQYKQVKPANVTKPIARLRQRSGIVAREIEKPAPLRMMAFCHGRYPRTEAWS